MKNKKFITESVAELTQRIKTMYDNKFYNLFMSSWDIKDLEPKQIDYVLRKYWGEGTVSAFKMPADLGAGFAPYAIQQWNMYDWPEVVNLINKWNVPYMPKGPQVVDKDVVIGFIQPNHKPLREIVSYYVDRLVQVELVLNTNLQLAKMPFLVGVTPTDADKARDIIARILNNEVVIFTDLEDLNLVKSIATETPYIIDKLYSYKISLENELLTYLGVDNMPENDKKERLIVDEVNANNEIINVHRRSMEDALKVFFDAVNALCGTSISVKAKSQPVVSEHKEDKSNEEDNQ